MAADGIGGYTARGVPGDYGHSEGNRLSVNSSSSNYGGYSPTITQAPSFNVTAAQASAAQASTAQAQATQAQLDAANPLLQQRMNEQLMQNNNDPFMGSLQRMQQGQYGPDDPSYQWRLQQGQQTAERSLASRGLLGSGNAAIELLQYGQGMASTEFGNQWNRLLAGSTGYQNMLSSATGRLGTLAGIDLGQRQLSAQNSQFNAGQLNQVGMFNAGQSNQVGMFNTGQTNQVGMFNAGQTNQVNLAGAAYGLQSWETANRNSLEQQRLQLEQTRQQTAAMASTFDYQGQAYWDQQQNQKQINSGAASARSAFSSGSGGSRNYSLESFGSGGGNYSLGNPSNENTGGFWSPVTSIGGGEGSFGGAGGNGANSWTNSYNTPGGIYNSGNSFSDGSGIGGE